MKISINSKQENPLLNATMVEATLSYEKATPSRPEVVKELAKQLKVKPELVVVRKITTAFGETIASVSAYVYKDEETLRRVEQEWLLKRSAPKKAEEQGPQEAKAEAPSGEGEKGKEAGAEESKEGEKGTPSEGDKEKKDGAEPAEKSREEGDKENGPDGEPAKEEKKDDAQKEGKPDEEKSG